MEERNPNRIHDETIGADDALRPAQGSTGRVGPAANATSLAIVVELTSEVTGTDAFCGRVQHLTTFDGGNFNSAESPVAIIRRVLERAQRSRFDK